MNTEVADDTGCFIVAGLPATGLAAQEPYGLLDMATEQALNEVAQLAGLCLEVPIALISLSDRVGKVVRPRGNRLARRDHSLPFCPPTVCVPTELMVVPDVRRDALFACNPFVATQPGIGFFAVAPLLAQTGQSVGALCVADYSPRDFSDRQCQMLLSLAVQVMAQLQLRANGLLLEEKLASQSRFMEQLKQEQQELQKQNATDPLTGLGNRRSFHDRVCLEIARAECTDTSVALMMIDVDFFKSYNDSFGHPAGDVVLKLLADLVLQSCRAEDFAARVGGEEFAVLLPGTSVEGAAIFANWLRRRVQRQAWPCRPVTISIGVAVANRDESALHLTARADLALYRSKRHGRDQVTVAEAIASE